MDKNSAVKIRCKGADAFEIDKLIEFQGNLKDLSVDNYNKLKSQILNVGFSEPISVWQNDGKVHVLNGHQRLRVLKGLKEEGFFIPPIPVSLIQADNVKDAKQKVLALTSQFGEMTDDGLYEFMNESGLELNALDDLRFPEIDLDKWKMGFGEDETSENENEIPEPPPIPVSKLGDLYELGDHRLLCGDSTNKENIEKLLMGETVDMVFTDPPYGVNEETFRKDKKRGVLSESTNFPKIIGDQDENTAKNVFKLSQMFSDSIVYWGANNYSFLPVSRGWIVWDKRENKGINDNGDAELAWTSFDKPIRTFYHLWKGMIKGSEQGQKRVHPTQKPISLAEWCFENYGDPKTVIDFFGGSGSTLIACEKTKRKCFIMELDPHYVDVIVSRWCKFTGQTQIKRNGETINWTLGE